MLSGIHEGPHSGMSNDSDFLKTREIIGRVLSVDPGMITLTSSMANLRQWDSLHFLTVVVEIEKAFGIKFGRSELRALRSVEALVKAIERARGTGGGRDHGP